MLHSLFTGFSQLSPTMRVVVIAALVIAAWVVHSLLWPDKPHRRCEGRGRHTAPGESASSRPCSGCRGTGRRRRFIPWLLDRSSK